MTRSCFPLLRLVVFWFNMSTSSVDTILGHEYLKVNSQVGHPTLGDYEVPENKPNKNSDSRQPVKLDPEDKNKIHIIAGIIARREGKRPSNAQVVTQALNAYLDKLDASATFTMEHARLGAAIMAALEKWKASDAKVSGLVVDQINFVLDVAAEEMGQ